MSNAVYLKLFVDCLEKYQKLNDTEFGRLVRAALRYKATGAEPDELGREALLWDGMRLDIDRDNESYSSKCSARAAAGKKGAQARWQGHNDDSKNGKCHLPCSKNGQDKDKEEDKDKEKEKDKDNTATAVDARAEAVSRVMTRYMDCIDSTPPSTVSKLLIAYTEELSADVVLHAIDIASGEGKRWSYIQAILKRYAKSKLDTLAKVKADEEAHEQRKSRSTSAVNKYTGPTQEEFEKMKRLAERLSQA